MSNLIECATCGYPLTPEERTTLVEVNGKMRKPWLGLTVDEVWQSDELMTLNAQLGARLDLLMKVVEAIEAKLKEKNT